MPAAAAAAAPLDPARTAFAVLTSTDAGRQRDAFYVRGHAVDLGRTARDDHAAAGGSKCALGDCNAISRQHARIAWDAAAGAWLLSVQGKNGVVVNDGPHLTPASPPHALASRDTLSIGDRRLVWREAAPGWPALGGDGEVRVVDAAAPKGDGGREAKGSG